MDNEIACNMLALFNAFEYKLPNLNVRLEKVLLLPPKSRVPDEIKKICSFSSPYDGVIDYTSNSIKILRQPLSKVPKPDPKHCDPKTCNGQTALKAKLRKNPLRCPFSYKSIDVPESFKSKPLKEYVTQITVHFYRPPRAAHRGFKLDIPVLAEDFRCLSTNTLSELRDEVKCICDGKRYIDISENPNATLPVLGSNATYFFIGDTFYNDRHNSSISNSLDTILKWAGIAKGLGVKQFKFKCMNRIRLMDIDMRLGKPLHFLHHGNCEHLFVISKIERVTLNKNIKYPHLSSTNNAKRRTCHRCGIRRCHFIVEKSQHHSDDPAYLCRECFFRINYKNGKKIGEFQAYRMYDEAEPAKDEKP